MDFLVGTVASEHRVKGSVTFGTIETFLVPHCTLGQLLFGGEYHATATGTPFAEWSLDRRSVRVVEWTALGDLVLAVTDKFATIYRNLKGVFFKKRLDSR